MSAERIALFPLGTVLFPGGPLALRIFETRYLDMVRRCMREDTGFGVVLIREGPEAGGPASTEDVGTFARIVDFSQQPDGLLGIRALGERRFRILACERARDGLNVAEVEWLPEERTGPLPEEFADLGPALHEVLKQFEDLYADIPPRLDDCAWVAARLAELLPLPDEHKQHCLELDDGRERLAYLRPMFEITPAQ